MTIKSATLRMPQRRVYSPASRRRRNTRSFVSIPAGFSLKAAAALLVLSLFLGLSFITSYKIHGLAQDIQTLEEHYAAVQQENRELTDKFSAISGKKKLARIGKKLGLFKPGEGQIITLR